MLKDESVAPAKFLGWGLVIAGCILGIFFSIQEHTRACSSYALLWQQSRIFEAYGSLAGLREEAIEYLLCASCSQRHGEFPSAQPTNSFNRCL